MHARIIRTIGLALAMVAAYTMALTAGGSPAAATTPTTTTSVVAQAEASAALAVANARTTMRADLRAAGATPATARTLAATTITNDCVAAKPSQSKASALKKFLKAAYGKIKHHAPKLAKKIKNLVNAGIAKWKVGAKAFKAWVKNTAQRFANYLQGVVNNLKAYWNKLGWFTKAAVNFAITTGVEWGLNKAVEVFKDVWPGRAIHTTCAPPAKRA